MTPPKHPFVRTLYDEKEGELATLEKAREEFSELVSFIEKKTVSLEGCVEELINAVVSFEKKHQVKIPEFSRQVLAILSEGGKARISFETAISSSSFSSVASVMRSAIQQIDEAEITRISRKGFKFGPFEHEEKSSRTITQKTDLMRNLSWEVSRKVDAGRAFFVGFNTSTEDD
jgi:exonuclease VII small subunit